MNNQENKNPPLSTLELKFRDIGSFKEYSAENRDLFSAFWHWQARLGDQKDRVNLTGICGICRSLVEFSTQTKAETQGKFKFRARWPGLKCNMCGLSATERRVASRISGKEDKSIYHIGYYSNLAKYLSEKSSNLVKSQYREGVPSGFVDSSNVRFEDLTNLSFDESSFDFLICTEILEHIPDYMAAIRESFRCLRTDGEAIFTFPWLGGDHYAHRERAQLMRDGSIHHILPPSYHGDPANEDGILCFRDFGWKILDEIRSVGFSDVFALYIFSPIHGYITLMEPLIIARKKMHLTEGVYATA